MTLENRILVLKKDGLSLQLPSKNYMAVGMPDGGPSTLYSSFRVKSLNQDTGQLILRHEKLGNLDESSFLISIETNSKALENQTIKSIIIEQRLFQSYVTPSKFNEDIKSDLRYKSNFNYKQGETISEVSKNEVPINQEISFPIKDLVFEDGLVSFSYFLNKNLGTRRFEIHNNFLKKEFDAIKNYFEKALGLKRIVIFIKIESIRLEVKEQSASSKDIEGINAEMIRFVEDSVIEAAFSISDDEIVIFRNKEDDVSKILGINVGEEQDWLLNRFLTPGRTKHYYHLRYLSSKHAAHIFDLRFANSPKSFIFLIETEISYFLIWETYETHEATYLWKLEAQGNGELLEEIESIVNKIKWLKQGNKRAYINSNAMNFKKIEHDYNHPDFGFNKWEMQVKAFVGVSS